MRYAERMNQLGTETAFEVLAKARALEAKGRSIVHLEIGEPDFDTPQFIRAAAVRALDEGFTHYGPSAGPPPGPDGDPPPLPQESRAAPPPPPRVVAPPGKPPLPLPLTVCRNP